MKKKIYLFFYLKIIGKIMAERILVKLYLLFFFLYSFKYLVHSLSKYNFKLFISEKNLI